MSDDSPSADERQTVPLETLLAHRASGRHRALQVASLVVALAVVGALLLRQLRAAQTVLTQPTPSGPGVVTVIESNTTWGTLTVNGRRLPGPPPQTVTIHGADNTITLDAPPFASVTCQVVVDPFTDSGTPVALSASSACGSGSFYGPSDGTPGPSVISFGLTGISLPATQQTAARQAIAGALAAQEVRATVPVGEYYAIAEDGQGRVVSSQATAPLAATNDIVPPPSPYSPPPPNVANSCGDLSCTSASFDPGKVPTGRVWSIQEPLFVQWRFMDASGTQVGQVAFGPLPFNDEFLLSPRSDGMWQVVSIQGVGGSTTVPGPVDQCPLVLLILQSYVSFPLAEITERSVGPLGCEFVLNDEFGRPNDGLFVWRFGALLAADSTAHRLIPALPIAPPREVAEAGTS